MSTTTAGFDARKYGRLLARALPAAIKTEEENERMLAEVSRLMAKGEGRITPEESRLLELMAILIEGFEREHYQVPEATPHEMLRFFMEERGVRQRDLLPVFGSRGIASEVVNGKRAISKKQAKGLGEYFGVSPELFL
ncbi:MAG: transcriptional regulator [Acidobacteriota bacterium]|nr:transcriptional regulator [Acidobacteriota bacterium]